MDPAKDSIYRRLLSCKLKGLMEKPKYSSAIRMYNSLTYCRIRSIFRMPVVYADSPSATDIMEKRMENQKIKSASIVTEADVKAYLGNETGKNRLQQMFTKTENGKYSTEIQNITLTLFNACGCAFVLSSVFTGVRAKEQFLEENRATVFKTKFRAERLMNDKIIIAVMKDGAKWAFRIGSFLIPFLFISQSIAVYRNKSSPLEYAAGSVVAGCLIKVNLGLKGCLAGGIVGGIMGLATGTMIYGLMYAAGELQEDRHFREIHDKLESQKEFQEMFAKALPEPSV